MICNPPIADHGEHNRKYLENLIEKNKTEISNTLVGDLSHINQRAECYNGIDIQSVSHLNDNEYLLEYSFDWFVYNGCSDMDEQDQHFDSVCFAIEVDGKLSFNFLDYEERSTRDEF